MLAMFKRSLVTVLVVLGMVAILAVARSGAAGVPQDVQALTVVVQNGFAAIQTALAQIQTTVNALGDSIVASGESNKRFTPTAFISVGNVRCEVANVSGDTQTVEAALLSLTGAVQNSATLTLGPGVSSRTESVNAPGFARCQFVVTTGSRTAIRGALVVLTGPAPGTDTLVVSAE
jgi:type II secretory pathway pseudopilin PulG